MLVEQIEINHRVDIQKIDDLPPLPIVANELLAALNNPDAEIDDIADIIIKDPGLTAKLLSLANSAFFSFGREVESISDAIINVLGLELVKGLSLGLIMTRTFDPDNCKGFNIERYWSNAILTASLTRNFSSICDMQEDIKPGYFYLYGLLHNIGLLVLVDCFPQQMNQVFLQKANRPDNRLLDLENQLLGLDHHAAGGHLAVRWNLPEDICIAMRELANIEYRGKYYQAAQLTGYCSRQVQHWLNQAPLTDRDELIPALLNMPLTKHNKIVDNTQQKIDDLNSVASSICH